MADDEATAWTAEQVAVTLTGAAITLAALSESVLGLTDLLSPPLTLGLLAGWLLWFLKLYAQRRLPPLLPGR